MRRFVLFLITLCTLNTVAQQPIVRARIQPDKGILVGQPVRLIVTILVPNYFSGSPDLPEFELENAIVVLPQETPQNSNERVGTVTYAGITETYTIYPQQPGDFQLPPADITVPYAIAPPQTTVAHLALPALRFHADLPAAAKDLDYFLPTSSLIMQQKWSQPLKDLHVGDSIERTITVIATKMQAMLIPPIPMEAPKGLRVYPEEPVVQDKKTDRGEFVYGQRVQSAKYFIQSEGDYTLPPIELKWWNLSSNRLVTATLPAVRFTAAANPNYVTELPPEPEAIAITKPNHVSIWARYRFWIRVAAPCMALVLLLSWIIWCYSPRIYRKWLLWHKQRRHSETAYFQNVQIACKSNRAEDAYVWLLKWLMIAHPGKTMNDSLDLKNDVSLSYEIESLGSALFAGNERRNQWNGRKLASLLAEYRHAQIAKTSQPLKLLNLNP